MAVVVAAAVAALLYCCQGAAGAAVARPNYRCMPRFAVVAAAVLLLLLLLLLPVPKVMKRQVKTSNGSVLRGGSAFHSQSVRRRTNNGDSN